MESSSETAQVPERFADIKREIASAYPDFQDRVTRAWTDVLGQLEKYTNVIESEGSNVNISLR